MNEQILCVIFSCCFSSLRISKIRVNISEIPIPGTFPAVGKKLWEINLPKEVIIGCILRGDTTMVPRGDTRILAGDMLVLISSDKQGMAAIYELTRR
ncbi:MAG: TrkA C-terminal domain-containing protein [Lachnospiraceae bacterium]|nr:TrkA C-terminal domain-containing protein [Lachnospiraceae bacterium]